MPGSAITGGWQRLRDWLLANDPAFSRLRQAARVTLTIVLSEAVLIAVHLWLIALPAAAYALGAVLSIQGGLSVRDRLPREQMKTRLIGCAASVSIIAIAAALENHRYVSDLAFLLIIFLAAYGRSFGQRWFAVGMFSVMSYFMGAYLHPALAEIPQVALGAVVSAVIAHGVRLWLLPDNWRRDLVRALESVLGRVDRVLAALLVFAERQAWTEADRNELQRLEERLKEAVLMADSLVPTSESEVLPGAGHPGSDIAIRLFDLHLAAESAIVVGLQSLPAPELVAAVMRHDDGAIARTAPKAVDGDDAGRAETVKALLWLRDARAAVQQSVAYGRATDFAGFAEATSEPAAGKPFVFSLSEPAVRAALQVTLASGLAMVFGLMLSRERWFWAVLTAFLVFTNTNSRGDTAIKALQRSAGTLLGIAFGLLLATLIGSPPVVAALVVVCVFAAFYWLPVSYATMTFFISIVICLVYSLTGQLTFELLQLRVEETLIGAVAGGGVAFLVLPVRARSVLETALAKWVDALEALLVAADGVTGHGSDLIGLSRRLDVAYTELATAARPLGVSWQLVTRPGHIRQTLALFMACTYWARIFASRMALSGGDVDDEVRGKITDARARLQDVAGKGVACFFIARKLPKSAGRHLPLSRNGSRLGIEMVDATLDRLYP